MIQYKFEMNYNTIITERKKIRAYLFSGAVIGILYACIEYTIRMKTGDDPQAFIPLLVRAVLAGSLITVSVIVFELLFVNWFRQKPFFYLLLSRSLVYSMIISFWLFIINGIWFIINGGQTIRDGIIDYLQDEMYLINLVSVFIIMVVAVGLGQINSLHRKGELINLILGKYHKPREIERIFCFIDLKGSTTIAEKIGHLKYAHFLKDYYSDITDALRKTNAQIYNYVGDEIILTWSYKNGLRNNNLVNCFFQMKKIIHDLKPKYLQKYGVHPEFKAGLHGGTAIVTWVGELKKEIVYVGDVLNTTARIQEDCKRLGKDFLISEELLNRITNLNNIKATFVDETILRGRESSVKLYSLELEG